MTMDRQIIHMDMDAFFASVEQVDNPELKGKPVIIGGESSRGVVATCSYEARKYGVHSAMPTYIAKQKCPHGIYLPVRYGRYKELSKEVFGILNNITELVEPLSIDEAYLDITSLALEPMDVARNLKEEVMSKTGLTLSIGISYNKFLAKLASDWNKPNGIKIITKDMIPHILEPLPVTKVYGIGRKSASKLNKIGIFTIEDLLRLPKEYIIECFGKYGIEVYNRIRGIDKREIEVSREIKSIGRETTLREDTRNKDILKEILKEFAEDICYSLNKRALGTKTITIKFKTSDFESHTKSKTINIYINALEDILNVTWEILAELEFDKDIRLIGLSLSNFSDNETKQLSFFD